MSNEYEYEYNVEEHDIPRRETHRVNKTHLLDPMQDLDLFLNSEYKTAPLIPGIENANEVQFNWTWNDNNVRFGQLLTRTQNLLIMGLSRRVEFNTKLHPDDKSYANFCTNDIVATYMIKSRGIGQYKFTHWIQYLDSIVRPGFWAITIDDMDNRTRDIFIYANGSIRSVEAVPFNKKTRLAIGTTK